MTATETARRVREFGGDIGILPDGRVALLHRSLVPDDLAAIARNHAADLRAYVAKFQSGSASFCSCFGIFTRTHGFEGSSPRLTPSEKHCFKIR